MSVCVCCDVSHASSKNWNECKFTFQSLKGTLCGHSSLTDRMEACNEAVSGPAAVAPVLSNPVSRVLDICCQTPLLVIIVSATLPLTHEYITSSRPETACQILLPSARDVSQIPNDSIIWGKSQMIQTRGKSRIPANSGKTPNDSCLATGSLWKRKAPMGAAEDVDLSSGIPAWKKVVGTPLALPTAS